MMQTENLMATENTLDGVIKIYYDLELPATQPAPLLIALHGYGANKRQMMREAKQIAPPGFALLSLQGFHQHIKEPKEEGGPLRFGFGWLTNFHPEDSVAIHHQALLDLIATLKEQGIVNPAKIFLLGFSQTCALNYRFAFTYPDILCGVMHLTGTRDEFYPPERVADYEERLGLRAATLKFKSYDAAHEIVPEMREDLRRWLADLM
jgi:phospholipase/carboxylesterase